MTNARIFFFILLSFAGGIAGRSFIEIPYAVLLLVFIVGFLAILAGILRQKRQLWAAGLMVLAVLGGIVRYDFYDYSQPVLGGDRKSTRLNSSHSSISYAVFCLKKHR